MGLLKWKEGTASQMEMQFPLTLLGALTYRELYSTRSPCMELSPARRCTVPYLYTLNSPALYLVQ